MYKKEKIFWFFNLLVVGIFSVFTFPKEVKAEEAAGQIELNRYYNLAEAMDKDHEVVSTKFNIPEAGRIRIYIEDCTAGIRLHIPFKRNTEIYESSWDTISEGNYIWNIGISGLPNKEARFKIEFQAAGEYNGERESNDTYDTANVINSGILYEGNYYRGGDSDIDIYKITLEKPGVLETDIKEIEGFLGDSRFRTSGRYCILSEDEHGNVDEVCQTEGIKRLRLPAGTYYISLSAPPIEYTIKADITYEDENAYEIEENNIKQQANSKAANKWYTGNLNTYKDIDYFQFALDEKSEVALELKVPRQSKNSLIKITLYNNDLKELLSAENTENPYLKTESVTVNPGTYYVRIEHGSANGAYLEEDYQFCLNSQSASAKEIKQVTSKKAKIKSAKNVKKKSITLKLSGLSGCDGYQIEYSTNKKFKTAKQMTKKSSTVTIKKLKKKKTYYVRARVYKKIDGKTYYGKWSSKKSVKIKK